MKSRNDKIIAAYRAGKSLRELSIQFGLSHEWCRQIVHRAGVKVRKRGRPWSRERARKR